MMRYLSLIVFCVALSACMPGFQSGDMDVKKTDYSQLEQWPQENHQALLQMMQSECQRLLQLPSNTILGGATSLPYGRTVHDWINACHALPSVKNLTDEDAQRYFEVWFQPYSVTNKAFYTGYYEPQIEASLRRTGEYQYPLYRRPDDLLRGKTSTGQITFGHWVNSVFQPYADRAAINAGALEGQGLEIVWLKNPVDVFFLQLQGSGRLQLPNGDIVRVAYDGRNGHPYVPIGRILVKNGTLRSEDVTAENIRDWLLSHPKEMQSVMEKNPNYVFFRKVDLSADEGPEGAFGISLTPQRSIAVDRSLVPYAAPIWIETSIKDQQGQATPWKRMVFAQDVGTDIRGAGRGDLFTGWGRAAEEMASDLKSPGSMTLFLPHSDVKIETPTNQVDSSAE